MFHVYLTDNLPQGSILWRGSIYLQRFLTNFFRRVFGRARRYLDWPV